MTRESIHKKYRQGALTRQEYEMLLKENPPPIQAESLHLAIIVKGGVVTETFLTDENGREVPFVLRVQDHG